MQQRNKTLEFFITVSALAALSFVLCPLSVAQIRDQGSEIRDQRLKFTASAPIPTQQPIVTASDEIKPRLRNRTDVFVPLLGSGTQTDGFSWSSRLWVHNLDASPANVQFFLFKLNQSNPTPAVYNDTLAAGETRRYDRAVETLFGEAGAAVLRVISDHKLIVRSHLGSAAPGLEAQDRQKAKGNNEEAKGIQDATLTDEQRTTDHGPRTEVEDLVKPFFAAVPASFAMSAGQKTKLFGEYQSSLLISRAPGFPVGLVETTGDVVAVKVTALDETGSTLASKDYTLAGFEPRLHNLSDFLSGASTDKIKLEVEVLSGPGKIIAFGSGLTSDVAMSDRFSAGERQASVVDEKTSSDKLTNQSDGSPGRSSSQASPQQGSVTGSGTAGRIAMWTGSQTVGDSTISEDAVGHVFIGSSPPPTNESKLWVAGDSPIAAVFVSNDHGTALQVSSLTGNGIFALSDDKIGVEGQSKTNAGVMGKSESGRGVYGVSKTLSGVVGESDMLHGVGGLSKGGGFGVLGRAENSALAGVHGRGTANADGVQGQAEGGGIGVKGNSNSGPGVKGESENGRGVEGQSKSRSGVYGESQELFGVGGLSRRMIGVLGTSVDFVREPTGQVGVQGQSKGGTGVEGLSDNATGVRGESTSGSGISGISETEAGVKGMSKSGRGVEGMSENLTGVLGRSTSGVGVGGISTSNHGMLGQSEPMIGVLGISKSNSGVQGQSESGRGVAGISVSNRGVEGQSKTRGGVAGFSESGVGTGGVSMSGDGLFGTSDSGKAGVFGGNVVVTGNITVAVKFFHIDHPLDPANKYLNHASVESPEMKNIYDGVVVLDNLGEAVVMLPDWFEALNKDFRYQLTAIGAPGPGLYIAEKMKHNRFKIAGGIPGMEVSWQVTGIRHDAYAQAHPVVVEEEKSIKERGTYLHPDLFGQLEEKGMLWVDHGEYMQQLKQMKLQAQGQKTQDTRYKAQREPLP
ncbi:MAG: hypothetical protein HY314_09590 [Acidobacteria bacterium]|nr:hypothetical protein [Acidobacteriota bacterium]